ncbi:MAG: insulinase family protein [Ruminococcus sp.]|nr:insulinase family protein [Ruminococcus sp.]
MAVSYVQKKIGNGIMFSGIYDKKFKSDFVSVRFITPLDEKISPRLSLLSMILGTSNKFIKSRTKLNEELIGLYDSLMSVFSYPVGDYQISGLSVRYIGDDYTINNENISAKATRILLDCIFNPHIEDGKFPQKYFDLRKQELIDNIKSEINDRRAYAVFRANQTVYKDEPASVSVNGSVEEAESITQSELFETYNKMLSESYIDISVGGGKPCPEIDEMIAKAFEQIERPTDININFTCPSPIKQKTVEVSEKNDVNQCKMIMAFKTESEDFYAQKLMCALLGGTPFSKLFANVREKLSLCYYCSSTIAECKKVMFIDSGIEKHNVEKAKKEILKQLEAISDGDFSDEMLENTKKALYNGFRNNYDSIAALNSWYFIQRVRGGEASPDDINEIIENISKERVVQAAKSFELDMVYLMEPEV